MVAKEKAKEFMQRAYDLDLNNKTTTKKCKEISLEWCDFLINYAKFIEGGAKACFEYIEVKKEINKL
tara:strand:+ start:216 stop:416 length:201 start_codon:yes stop_codon:yes gene_type:complete